MRHVIHGARFGPGVVIAELDKQRGSNRNHHNAQQNKQPPGQPFTSRGKNGNMKNPNSERSLSLNITTIIP